MNITRIASRYGLLLGLAALICTALSTGVYFLTKDRIDAVVAEQQRELLLQVIPQSYFDNNLMNSCRPADKQIQRVCVAQKDGRITAYALEATAPDGYSGDIRLLVGMTPQGEILGVRVLEHKETPGLGDKIETRISDWILTFSGQKISRENQQEWAVKKDGGKFDQFTGATITPRAVVNQVKRSALQMLETSQAEK